MARWHRSSDGPSPYGPTPEPPGQPMPQSDPAPPTWAEPPGEPHEVPDPHVGAPPLAPPFAPPPDPGQLTSLNPGPPPPPPGGAPLPVSPWAPPPGAYSATVPGAQGLQYGRTLDRVMAYLLDGFVVSVPVLIVSLLLGSGVLGGLRQGGLTLVAGILGAGIHLLYFVSFWTGGAQATPGMRLMKLRIGDARTGAVLTVQQGMTRWLALGGVFQLIGLVPPLLFLSALLAFAWELVLLATTASSPTKQGLHDKMANTALVQPVGAQTPAVTCLVIVVALFALWVLGLVLVLLSGDVSRILSAVGRSI